MNQVKEFNTIQLDRRTLLTTCAGLLGSLLFEPWKQAIGAAVPPKNNIIQEENRKKGTKDWLLKNPLLTPLKSRYAPFGKGVRSEVIEGYCSKSYVKAGEEIQFFVSTNPVSTFVMDFYRLGYYSGDGARFMKHVGPLDGFTQETPTPGNHRVIECYWKAVYSFKIPKEWLSGIYIVKLTEQTSQHDSYMIFVVSDTRKAAINFQCADMTWQSYNRWPNLYSLYMNEGTDSFWGPGVDVCLNRPFSKYPQLVDQPLSIGSGSFFLWEFPFVFWAEMMGYDITYTTSWATHYEGTAGLNRCNGFITVGHDEYWTQQMFDTVVAARDQGLSLAFLSGNSVFGKLTVKATSKGQPNKVLERVSAFKNENTLMGSMSGGGTYGFGDWICCAPDHWIFKNTGMRFGEAIKGLVGWEFHDNCADLPGLIKIAEGKTGSNPNPEYGGAGNIGHYTATYYEVKGKSNFVFNAATCWWTDGLSAPPGYLRSELGIKRNGPDIRVQQITQNILDRMAGLS